ncbi:MAG: PHP domain-containing protein [Clostridia bacterium]|nr:PHP domain-containing protein [Clostridia bacterium]
MRIKYDLHIHSALSPCADDNMTPSNIVGFAKLQGLDAVAIADHNAIANVKVAMDVGNAFDVVVVPAMELQTAEDIHILCLFEKFEDLQSFYNSINFADIQNRAEIFGEQLILDEDDNILGKEQRMLLVASGVSVEEVVSLAKQHNGIAIAAHIDREENGMVAILGTVTEDFSVVEISATANQQIQCYTTGRKVITNSDAHTLEDIGVADGELEVTERSAKGILQALR